MSSSFTSSSFIVASKINDFINGLDLGFNSSLSLDGIYDVFNNDSLTTFVSPLTTVIGYDARDVIRERVATQILIVKRAGRENEVIDLLTKKIEDLQTSLFFLNIVNNNNKWITEQVELNGTAITAGGDSMDGIFNSDEVGDAGVFKTSLIVASSRFLKAQ